MIENTLPSKWAGNKGLQSFFSSGTKTKRLLLFLCFSYSPRAVCLHSGGRNAGGALQCHVTHLLFWFRTQRPRVGEWIKTEKQLLQCDKAIVSTVDLKCSLTLNKAQAWKKATSTSPHCYHRPPPPSQHINVWGAPFLFFCSSHQGIYSTAIPRLF